MLLLTSECITITTRIFVMMCTCRETQVSMSPGMQVIAPYNPLSTLVQSGTLQLI